MSAPTRTPGEVLAAARRADSLRKRQRTLAELERMIADGEPVTFTAVARAANVSSWLVYSSGIRERIAAAMAHQERRPAREAVGRVASAAGLKLDLEMARAEIAELRDERDRLRAAVRRQLGEQLDQIGHRGLVERIDELTGQLRAREQSEAAARADAERLRAQVRDLEDDLAAARTSLRTVLKDVNRGGAVADTPGSGHTEPAPRAPLALAPRQHTGGD